MQKRNNRILMLHQGAELYGSDKIFLIVARILSKNSKIDIILDSDGPLVDELRKLDVHKLRIMKLGVIRRGAVNNPLSAVRLLIQILRSVWSLSSLNRRNRYDIVYVNTLALISPLFMRFAAGRPRVIHHIHEIQNQPRVLVNFLYRISARFSDTVVVVSEAVKSHIEKVVPASGMEKFVVVNNGISENACAEESVVLLQKELESSLPKAQLPRKYVAMVGRLHRWKGQLQLLDILAVVKRSVPDITVIFFGDVFPGNEDLKEEIFTKVDALDLNDNVYFAGERRDSQQLFALCGVSLMPSTSPDPFPTVVLESMREGAVVIAYAHGGVVEMIDNNKSGILVPVCDTDGLAEAIVKTCLDAEMQSRIGDAAREKFLANFTIQYFERNLLENVFPCLEV